jgi:hypothetical protein
VAFNFRTSTDKLKKRELLDLKVLINFKVCGIHDILPKYTDIKKNKHSYQKNYLTLTKDALPKHTADPFQPTSNSRLIFISYNINNNNNNNNNIIIIIIIIIIFLYK